MRFPALVAAAIAASGLTLAAEQSSDINWKIRREAIDNSQIMKTLHVLTDVYGPRLTGSPNLKAAGEWAVKQMESWGLANGRLEPWTFGHPGWLNERFSAHLIAPVKDALVGEVLAWTPSTKGTAKGQVVRLVLPERPAQADLTAFFTSNAAAVKGKIVLVGTPAVVPVSFNGVNKRLDTAEARARFDANNPTPSPIAETPRRETNQILVSLTSGY